MSPHDEITAMGDRALAASRKLVLLQARKKNMILEAMAEELGARRSDIQAENRRDMLEGENAGLSRAMLDRLLISDSRMDAMIKGLRDVAVLKAPSPA